MMIRSVLLSGIAAIGGIALAGVASLAQEDARGEMRTVEIRSYNLKPGMHERFRRLFNEEAFPMLQRANIDVIAFGPSLHDENSWFLMRSFSSVGERQASEDAFYGSREWVEGPRNAVLDCIESYTTLVVELDGTTVEGLRNIAHSK